MKVVYINGQSDEQRKLLLDLVDDGIHVELFDYDEREKAKERAAEFDAIIGARVSREFLEKAVNLKHFIIPFTGVPPHDLENLPDFPNITVYNSHFNSQFVAELAWGLLLASAKKMIPAHEKMRQNDWTPMYEDGGAQSFSGKTILLIGYGEIGKAVGKIARAFNLKVMAIKRTKEDAPELDFLGTREDLKEVLPKADFIVLSLPGVEDCKGFLGEAEFNLMKDDVHIVNVGRGNAIDQKALYEGLKSGKVGGAGIDTWWNYPKSVETRTCTQPSDHPLNEFDNVIFSPHRASDVDDREWSRMRHLAMILNSIKRGDPVNIVDLKHGY
jgi:D-3-phosphoglycerate dehydrogenase